MTDRVHPAAKPNPPPPAAAAVNGNGPAKTNQLYNPNRPRPVYRPPNKNRRSRSCSCRKCCCLGFLYTLIALLVLLLLAAIAACIFYLLYHPKHPTFRVSSLRLHRFNLTQPDPTGFAYLNSRVDLTLTAKNPNNKKISFVYDPMLVALGSAGVDLGNATLPGFAHVAGNTTILRATVASDATRDLDTGNVNQFRSDLNKNRWFPVTLVLNMMVEVEMGKIKTKKVGVRVTCEGIKGIQPNKKKNGSSKKVGSTLGITSSSNCKVVLRIKIWKFTF